LLLHENVRLVSLTGPGGTGKTRLAVEAASTLIGEFPSGIFLVSLSSVTESNLVLPAVVSTLGISEKPGKSIEDTLKDFLREKRILLVLDNFEQVVSAASLVADLLSQCPMLKILVTSRQALRLRAEHQFPVPPLEIPDLTHMPEIKELLGVAAVALFVQRAQAIRPDFTVTSENAQPIAQICARLDGLPLALELAAARVRVLSLETLLSRLQKRLELLTAGPRDLPARQQTLRKTIEWSYELLTDEDRKAFRGLAIFNGSFSLEAVEEICLPRLEAQEILDQISRLVEKSLLTSETMGREQRFRMLETIREFALKSLEASDEMGSLEERFLAYYLSLAERSEQALKGPEQKEWVIRLDLEQENLRAALHMSLEENEINLSMRICAALWRFWSIRGQLSEGRIWLNRALSKPNLADDVFRAKALWGAGALAAIQDDDPIAHRLLNESLALSRKVGDAETTAFSLNSLGNVVRGQGDLEDAKKLLTDSLAIFERLEDKWGTALVLSNLGVNARFQGDFPLAIELHEQSLRLFRELGDKRLIARSLINLGIIFERKEDYERACGLLKESLALFRELGEKTGIAESLRILGSIMNRQNEHESSRKMLAESIALSHDTGNKAQVVECLEEFARSACMKGEAKRAARLLGATEAIRNEMKIPIPPPYRADHQHDLSLAQSTLGEKTFTQEYAQGGKLTLEEAVAYALTPDTRG
jgi:predicted ATPase